MMLLGFFGLEFAFRQSKHEASNVLKTAPVSAASERLPRKVAAAVVIISCW